MDDQGKASAAVQRESTRRSRGWLVRAAGGFATLCLALPLLARAGCQVETVELPVRMAGSRAIATVGINGKPVPLTVDSGAVFSMLTDAAAAQLNLRLRPVQTTIRMEGLTGRIDARMTTVDKLRLFKSDFNHVDFIVGGNEPGAGTEGLMGRNILSLGDTEYDLANGVVRFQFPNDDCARSMMAYWAGTSPVTEVDLIANNVARAPSIRSYVKLNGKEFIALFDTGASTIVNAGAARRAGVAETDWKLAGTMYGAGRGNAKLFTAPFERFELGGEAISHNQLRVADFDLDEADMLLGIDFFLSHRIYVSKQQSKMFFTYNGGTVFALNQSDTVPAVPEGDGPADGASDAMTADQLARRGAASAERRDYQSALADLNRACALEPTSALYLTQRAGIEDALKQPAKALADLDRALELDPKLAGARLRRATLRIGAKDRDGANADLDAVDRMLAPQAQMRLALARVYLGLEQPAKAIVQLDQWLSAHPNEATRHVALNSRCWARAMLGTDLDRAIDDCDDALDGDPKNAAYLDSRGWVYLRQGKYAKAVADFDRSIAMQPANASSLYGRGLARKRLGDAAQGDADLAAARKLQDGIDDRLSRIGLLTDANDKP